jgi:hypothetical protein
LGSLVVKYGLVHTVPTDVWVGEGVAVVVVGDGVVVVVVVDDGVVVLVVGVAVVVDEDVVLDVVVVVGGGVAGAVLKARSEPYEVPLELVATRRKWYVVPAESPVSFADTGTLPRLAAMDWPGVVRP